MLDFAGIWFQFTTRADYTPDLIGRANSAVETIPVAIAPVLKWEFLRSRSCCLRRHAKK